MTQKEMILQYMKDNGSISSIEAACELGIIDLRKIVSNMILHDGLTIYKESFTKKNRYGKLVTFNRYSLGAMP